MLTLLCGVFRLASKLVAFVSLLCALILAFSLVVTVVQKQRRDDIFRQAVEQYEAMSEYEKHPLLPKFAHNGTLRLEILPLCSFNCTKVTPIVVERMVVHRNHPERFIRDRNSQWFQRVFYTTKVSANIDASKFVPATRPNQLRVLLRVLYEKPGIPAPRANNNNNNNKPHPEGLYNEGRKAHKQKYQMSVLESTGALLEVSKGNCTEEKATASPPNPHTQVVLLEKEINVLSELRDDFSLKEYYEAERMNNALYTDKVSGTDFVYEDAEFEQQSWMQHLFWSQSSAPKEKQKRAASPKGDQQLRQQPLPSLKTVLFQVLNSLYQHTRGRRGSSSLFEAALTPYTWEKRLIDGEQSASFERIDDDSDDFWFECSNKGGIYNPTSRMCSYAIALQEVCFAPLSLVPGNEEKHEPSEGCCLNILGKMGGERYVRLDPEEYRSYREQHTIEFAIRHPKDPFVIAANISKGSFHFGYCVSEYVAPIGFCLGLWVVLLLLLQT